MVVNVDDVFGSSKGCLLVDLVIGPRTKPGSVAYGCALGCGRAAKIMPSMRLRVDLLGPLRRLRAVIAGLSCADILTVSQQLSGSDKAVNRKAFE